MVHRGETNQRGLVGESPLGQVEAPTEAGVRPAPGLEACGVDGVGRGSRSARGQGRKRGWAREELTRSEPCLHRRLRTLPLGEADP